MALIRTEPHRCTGKFEDSQFDDERFVAEPKLDGGRYMLYIEAEQDGGGVHLYSRRRFPEIDKAAVAPHFAKRYEGLGATILDGEVMLPDQKDLGETTAILNMTPANAAAAQRTRKLRYYVFDILTCQGEDVRHLPLNKRRQLLEMVVARMNNEHVVAVPQTGSGDLANVTKSELWHAITDVGGEGIVIKKLSSPYGKDWIKCKRMADFSVIVSGFKPGLGKYDGTLGALAFSVYNEKGELQEVGFCAGMTDAERDDMWKNQAKWLGQVIDIQAQEVTKDNRMRHPRWFRKRDDVEASTCTLAKLHADAKNHALKGGK